MQKKAFLSLLFALAALLATTSALRAQSPSTMTLGTLEGVATGYVVRGDYAGGIPYMQELLNRFGEDPQYDTVRQSLTFLMGRGYMQRYSQGDEDALLKGTDTFKKYIESYPNGSDYIFSLANLADCLRAQGKFLDAAPYLKELALNPRASRKMRDDAREKLVQAYYVKSKWKEGLDSFLMVLRDAYDYEIKAYAGTAAMQAYIETDQIDKALEMLPGITGNNPARYNLSFNLALLKTGDELVKKKSFIKASLLFTMTLTIDEIRTYYRSRIQFLESRIRELELSTSEEAPAMISDLKTDIKNIDNQLEAIKEVKDYTPELRVRIARTYVQTGRDWEGFWAYMQLINEHPDHELIELFTYSAFAQAKRIDMERYIRELGERYLAEENFVKYRPEVGMQLAQYYYEEKNYERLFEIANWFINEQPNHRYTSAFVYWMGDAYMKMRKPDEMFTELTQYLEQYPTSPMVDGLLFWSGLGAVFTDRLQPAFERFDRIVNDFPNSPYYPDSLYRSGVAAFGLENYEFARKRFFRVIDEHPQTEQRGEGEFFLGQIFGMEGTLEGLQKAFEHYNQVEKYTTTHRYIKDAYFKMAELQEVNQMFSDMAETLRRYINNYPEEGSVTEATFMLGTAYENMGRPADMLNEYLRAIERFGSDQTREGIDKIIEAYPEKYYEKYNTMTANIQFLEKLLSEPEFLDKIVGWLAEPPIDPVSNRPIQDPKTWRPYRDKRFMFQYFGNKTDEQDDFDPTLIDASITRKFQRDDAFAKGLLVDTSPLREMLREWQEMGSKFPPETPEEAYTTMYYYAKDIQEMTLMFRLMRELQKMGEPIGTDYIFSPEDFEYGSPSLIVWMGEKAREVADVHIALQAWEQVAAMGISTPAALDALMNLGDLYAYDREEYARAYEYYKQAQTLFPAGEHTAEAAMKQGDMLRFQGLRQEANEAYATIMKTPLWRGPRHAEASYKIGLNFFEIGDYENAHAILNRTYISYGFHTEWAAQAYLKDAETLMKLGKREEARMTLQEFLDNEDMRATKYYPEAESMLNSL